MEGKKYTTHWYIKGHTNHKKINTSAEAPLTFYFMPAASGDKTAILSGYGTISNHALKQKLSLYPLF